MLHAGVVPARVRGQMLGMTTDLKNATRRSFISRMMSGIATLGLSAGTPRAAEAQLVWKASEWKLAEFQKLVNEPARVKQVFDVVQIDAGKSLNNVKNALNGLRFGFAIPENEIKIVAGLHGAANMLNYDDYVWDKYKIGEWLNVTDPSTGKSAVKNPFYGSKGGLQQDSASKGPDDPDSIYQDTSMQALQARGVQFLSCHTALEEQVRVLIKRNKLTLSPEHMVREMLAHTEPGVLVVATMVAAIAVLQAEGHYTYIAV
jgi:intracellular sulfur oxidation DsrE/DsrF family protein